MRILILGITGKTGLLVAEEAIKRGHKIVGIARDPSMAVLKSAEILKGTPYDFDTVKNAVNACDAVICTLGLFRHSQSLFGKLKSPSDILSVSMKNTVKAMGEYGIKRIVVMTALGAGDSATELPAFFSFLVRISNIRYSYTDHTAQEKILEKSALDWTIVRPVGLNDNNDDLSILYNLNGVGKITSSVSRNAVAHFMIDCIEKEQFIREKPGISNA